jgi:hypothetical protein
MGHDICALVETGLGDMFRYVSVIFSSGLYTYKNTQRILYPILYDVMGWFLSAGKHGGCFAAVINKYLVCITSEK